MSHARSQGVEQQGLSGQCQGLLGAETWWSGAGPGTNLERFGATPGSRTHILDGLLRWPLEHLGTPSWRSDFSALKGSWNVPYCAHCHFRMFLQNISMQKTTQSPHLHWFGSSMSAPSWCQQIMQMLLSVCGGLDILLAPPFPLLWIGKGSGADTMGHDVYVPAIRLPYTLHVISEASQRNCRPTHHATTAFCDRMRPRCFPRIAPLVLRKGLLKYVQSLLHAVIQDRCDEGMDLSLIALQLSDVMLHCHAMPVVKFQWG